MALKTRKPQPDPERQYEAVVSFSGPDGAFNPGTRLTGDHPALRAAFGSFMLADLPDDEKAMIRNKAMWGDVAAYQPPPTPAAPVARRPSGRFRAVRSWSLADPYLPERGGRLNAGDLVDANDEVYRRYPHLFVPHVEER